MLSNKTKDCWTKETHNQIIDETSHYLWRFVQKNSELTSVDDLFMHLTKLAPKDLKLLGSIYFLLSEEVEVLINEVAPAILKKLSKITAKEARIYKGNARGKISWNKTYKERYAFGGDPSLFVCIQKSSDFDLPENRLLLYIIRQILKLSSNLLGTPVDDYNEVNFSQEASTKWIDKVKMIFVKTQKLLKNPFISNIMELHELSLKVIISTKKVRGHAYKTLAEIADKLYLLENSLTKYLNEELNGKILKPLNKDTLYEIAVLFKIQEVLRANEFIENKVVLIGNGNNIVSKFEKSELKAKIYYQSLPKIFQQNSKYGPLMNAYGLSNKLRRPDILLEISNNNKKRFYIIEVKRSESRRYLVDGAYKLFGYLKDFEDVKSDTHTLSGVLVGWSNIKLIVQEKNEIYLSSWDRLEETIAFILESELIELSE
ncbi:hypothetical protein [Lysinibacillus capsici]|uniref:hypothetical protein n=1 Tax=Lysinibacillus capsici TaxID=2115968 RepID=UPI0036869E1D